MQASNGRILLADENEENREVLLRWLLNRGFLVHFAPTGRHVLNLSEKGDFELVLLSSELPDPPAIETLQALRAGKAMLELPVIFLVGDRHDERAISGLKAGANDVVHLPMDLDALLARIHTQLELRRNEERRNAMLRQSENLLHFTRSLNRQIQFQELMHVIRLELPRQLGVELFSLFLQNPVTGSLELAVHNHEDWEDGEAYSQSGVMEDAFRRGVPVKVERFSESAYGQGRGHSKYRTDNALCLPLHLRESVLGVLNLNNFPERLLSDEYVLEMEKLAEHLSLAIQNAILFRQIKEQSVRDELTRLFNRRYLFQELHKEVERARRYGQIFSLLMLDIDHFKEVNDTHGHGTGDEVLRHVSARIKSGLRGSDVPCRYGGEEFVIILPSTYEVNALKLAERIRESVGEESLEVDGGELRVTLSIGVAQWGQDEDSDTVLRKADTALYRAKKEGRNRCVVEP